MLSKYFVVQENETGRKRKKLLFQGNCTVLYTGMEIPFKNKRFKIMQLLPNCESIDVICYEIKRKYYEEITKNTTSGNTEDDRVFE